MVHWTMDIHASRSCLIDVGISLVSTSQCLWLYIVMVFLLGPNVKRKGQLRRPLLLLILEDSNYSTWFYVLYHLDNLLRVCVDGKASKGGGIKGFKDKIPRCAPMLFISLQRKDENWCNSKLHFQMVNWSVAWDFFCPFDLVQEGDLGFYFIFGFGGVENSPG